ncbi:asparaginase [Sagittula sp. M10.9X]|uniref:Asparaginase n=2 Tax=Sagittula salina TaxID=2820268 RepID=A0A940S0K1_9RHOB|nr:asparaginase [Sagittula salina]
MVEVVRGPLAESRHSGHAVICDASGEIMDCWGNPEEVILPRSSAKMLQALPLVASGAADAASLSTERLALACASHQGAPLHNQAVAAWLADIGRSESDLICGPEPSRDKDLRLSMIRDREDPRRIMNNCSGKHTGFLTLTKHLRAGPDYCCPDHAVQRAIRSVFEEVTGETSPGYGIDGCSAPNFATTMHGMARAMAFFGSAETRGDVLSKSATRLTQAMIAHPAHVAGEGRACTLLMRAAKEPVAIKTGAEGYFIAILPERGQGVSLKIADGATRASDCAIAALLVRLGVVDAEHPDVKRFLNPAIHNFAGTVTGEIRPKVGVF